MPTRKLTAIVSSSAAPAKGQSGTNTERVNHPPHYNFGSIEIISAIEDWKLGFHLGNAVKYIARADHKGNRLEDLKKAVWYLQREIDRGH